MNQRKRPRKLQASFRLSDEAMARLRARAKSLGISQAAVLEMLIREAAWLERKA